MNGNINYLFLRGLRQVDHTVFCVSAGQKFYNDPTDGSRQPYSSGQQVKRSMLDMMGELLNEARATLIFNYEIDLSKPAADATLDPKEVLSAADPSFADQLIGGYMRAKSKKAGKPKKGDPNEEEADGEDDTQESKDVIKRRSPLSISCMRPLHPKLATINPESLTFDRSDNQQGHRIFVRNPKDGKEIPHDKVLDFLRTNELGLRMRTYMPDGKVGGRASGLFVFDVAVDLRTLFTVSTKEYEREISLEMMDKLVKAGWQKSVDGLRLICPKEKRDAIIPALAKSLIEWRITSNQSRTYSPMNTLAVAIGDNANRIGAAIRADLSEEETERLRAVPVIDPSVPGVELFTALTARGYIRGVTGSADALEQAEQYLIERMTAFEYK